MNSVILIGRLTKNPEMSYTTGNNTAVARFTLAVDKPKRDGQDQGADFIRIVVFGKTAENCERYLSKGRQVGVQGRIQTGSYKNKEGVTVYTTDILAESVEFLGSTSGQSQQSYQKPEEQLQNNYGNQGYQQQMPPQNYGGYQQAPSNNGGYGTQPAGYQNQGQAGFNDIPPSFQAIDETLPF